MEKLQNTVWWGFKIVASGDSFVKSCSLQRLHDTPGGLLGKIVWKYPGEIYEEKKRKREYKTFPFYREKSLTWWIILCEIRRCKPGGANGNWQPNRDVECADRTM